MHFSPASCLMKDINLFLLFSKVLILSFVFLLFAGFCQLSLGVSTNPPQLEQDSYSWVPHLQASQSSSYTDQSESLA